MLILNKKKQLLRETVTAFLKHAFWLQKLPLNLKFQIILKPGLFEIFY